MTPGVVPLCPAGPAPELADPRRAVQLCIWQPSLHPGLFTPQPPSGASASGASASGAELLSPAESSGLRLPFLWRGMRGEVLLLILELPGSGLVVWVSGFPAFTAVAQIQSLVGELRPRSPRFHQREKKPDAAHKKYKIPH